MLFVFVCFCLFVCLFVCFCLFVCLFVCFCLFVCLFVCLVVWVFVWLSGCLVVCYLTYDICYIYINIRTRAQFILICFRKKTIQKKACTATFQHHLSKYVVTIVNWECIVWPMKSMTHVLWSNYSQWRWGPWLQPQTLGTVAGARAAAAALFRMPVPMTPPSALLLWLALAATFAEGTFEDRLSPPGWRQNRPCTLTALEALHNTPRFFGVRRVRGTATATSSHLSGTGTFNVFGKNVSLAAVSYWSINYPFSKSDIFLCSVQHGIPSGRHT